MKWLFMGDAHIKSRTWTNNIKLQGDAYYALHKLVTDLNGARVLVSAGDWFDTVRPSAEDVRESLEFFSHFTEILYIPGNHDNTDPYWLTALADNEAPYFKELSPSRPIVYTERPAVFGPADPSKDVKTAFYGVPWTGSRQALLNSLHEVALGIIEREFTTVNIVLHTAFKELLAFEGSYELTIQDIDELFKDCSTEINFYVGHVHVRKLLHHKKGLLHSPGPLFPCNIAEAAHECFVSLVDGSRITDIPSKARSYTKLRYTTLEKLKEAIGAAVAPDTSTVLYPYIRCVLPANVEVDALAVQEEYPNAVIDFIKEGAEDVHQITETQAITVEQVLKAELDEDSAAIALSIYNSEDPVKTIADLLDYWKVERIC